MDDDRHISAKLPKLKGSQNYREWKELFTQYLIAVDAWDMVKGVEKYPEATFDDQGTQIDVTREQKDFRKRDNRAAFQIFYSCDDGPRQRITGMDEMVVVDKVRMPRCRQQWQALAAYEGKGFAFLSTASSQLQTLTAENRSVEEYCQEFTKLVR